MSTHDVVAHYFEHEKVAHALRTGGRREPRLADERPPHRHFVFVGFLEPTASAFHRRQRKLTDALIACIKDKGGEVLAGVDVESVIVKQAAPLGPHERRARVHGERCRDRRHSFRITSVAWFPCREAIVRDARTEVSPVACITFMRSQRAAEIQGGRSRARRDDRAAAQSI